MCIENQSKINSLSLQVSQLSFKEEKKEAEAPIKHLPIEINDALGSPLRKAPEEKDVQEIDQKKEDNPIENTVGLEGFILEAKTFEEALEILNVEGEKAGVGFKRGNIHYYDSKSIRDRRIICIHKNRNADKKPRDGQGGSKESFDQVSDVKSPLQFQNCPVFYRFVYDKDSGEMSFSKSEETHNHLLGLSQSDLSEKMKSDISLFHKRSKVNNSFYKLFC